MDKPTIHQLIASHYGKLSPKAPQGNVCFICRKNIAGQSCPNGCTEGMYA